MELPDGLTNEQGLLPKQLSNSADRPARRLPQSMVATLVMNLPSEVLTRTPRMTGMMTRVWR
jgi:hypothetical protein